jgi:hypothetical protein
VLAACLENKEYAGCSITHLIAGEESGRHLASSLAGQPLLTLKRGDDDDELQGAWGARSLPTAECANIFKQVGFSHEDLFSTRGEISFMLNSCFWSECKLDGVFSLCGCHKRLATLNCKFIKHVVVLGSSPQTCWLSLEREVQSMAMTIQFQGLRFGHWYKLFTQRP